MATRFYLPSTGVAAVSPAVASTWEITDVSFIRIKCVTTRISSALTEVNLTEDSPSAANQDWCFIQYVSDPLAAQTLNPEPIVNDVKFQMRGMETAANNNMFFSWIVRVVSNDGGTVRGTFVAHRRDGTELAVSTTDPLVYTNRGDVASSSTLTVEDGDRIVIEIGTGGTPVLPGAHASGIVYGDDSGTDLPENNTSTATNNPWVQFTDNIVFQAATGQQLYAYAQIL